MVEVAVVVVEVAAVEEEEDDIYIIYMTTHKAKSWKGGQILTYGFEFITYAVNVMTSVTATTGKYTYDNFFSILYHVMFMLAYVVCFYFLQFKNTEIPSMVMFAVLHCVFLFMILVVKIKLPWIEKGNIASYGSFSMYIISLGWIFLLIALAFVLKVYYDLYYMFIPNGVDIDFGTAEPLRAQFVKYFAYTTVFMWSFYALEYIKTNDVLLLNLVFIVLAFVFLVAAIYLFIQRWMLWGVLSTVVSFLSMTMVKTISDAHIDYELFFTRNQMANNVVLFLGILFNLMAIYVYYLSSKLVEYTKSIAIPDILQMNPAYREGFVMNKVIHGMDCSFDSQDEALYKLLKDSDPDTMNIVYRKYCRPIPESTPTPPLPNIQEKLLDMWDKRGGLNDGSRPGTFMDLVNSTSKFVPSFDGLTPTPTPGGSIPTKST